MNPRYWPLIATITIFVVAYALAVMQFPALFSTRVLGNLLTDNAFLGVTAVGMTFVILSGGIDLSVGSVIAYSSVLILVMIAVIGGFQLLVGERRLRRRPAERMEVAAQ